MINIFLRLIFPVFLLVFCGVFAEDPAFERPFQETAPQVSGLAVDSSSLDKKLEKAILVVPDMQNLVGYLHIGKDRPIDGSTYLYVKFALEHYKKLGVSFILLDLDTPGGEVFSSMKIADLLHQIDVQDHIPVVAFIDNWAISAGAMLVYSSRFIGITKTASMGAAEPIMMGSDGKAETASEKVNSALRAEMINLARFYGRDPLIAEAMVDKDMILVRRDGKIIRLEKEEEVRTQGQNPDQVISRKGKLLTLNAQELIDYGIADFLVEPHPLTPVTQQEWAAGEWPASKNLLFQESFFAQIPQATIVSYSNWKVAFFSFLSHPLISSLLFMGLIVGVYMEMSHPGFGFPGILAVVCLGLVLLSSFAVETANSLELIFLATGLLLLLVEIFILPGFGIAGVLGILITLFALFALTVPTMGSLEFSWDWEKMNIATLAFFERLGYFIGTLLLSVLVIILIARYVTPTLLRRSRLVLEKDQEGYVASSFEAQMIGKTGTVMTELKPAGHILVEGQPYQALSEAGFLSKGDPIEVIGGRGAYLIVRKLLKETS